MPGSADVTRLLERLKGDSSVVDSVLPLVYQELRVLAHRQMIGERAGHTLNTTALVHEAYLKLVQSDKMSWANRAHFFSMAAIAMRRILIDYARRRRAEKRGGGEALATFDEQQFVREVRADELIDLDDALQRLEELDERQSRVVTYKFFGGLKHSEIAEVLSVSVPTVHRDWRLARAWLSREMKRDMPE